MSEAATLKVGDRVWCLAPGHWADGHEGTVTALGGGEATVEISSWGLTHGTCVLACEQLEKHLER